MKIEIRTDYEALKDRISDVGVQLRAQLTEVGYEHTRDCLVLRKVSGNIHRYELLQGQEDPRGGA